MVALQVFDDDGALGNRPPPVHQQGHLARGPQRQEGGALYRVTQVQQTLFAAMPISSSAMSTLWQ
jgi:hypothetical protein